MRLSHSTIVVLAAMAVSGLSSRLRAQPITLNNSNGNQSSVVVDAYDDFDGGSSSTNNINSLPFTTPTTVTDGTSSSTVDSALSTSALNFTFTQSTADDGSRADGTGTVYFTAGASTTFSISGDLTLTGRYIEASLVTTLTDLTTSTTVYNYNNYTFNGGAENAVIPASAIDVIAPTSTLTLDSTGGSLTGSLNAGDVYEFQASEEMDNQIDPTLNGNVGITFNQPAINTGPSSAPLPTGAAAGLVLLFGLGAAFAVRRRLAA